MPPQQHSNEFSMIMKNYFQDFKKDLQVILEKQHRLELAISSMQLPMDTLTSVSNKVVATPAAPTTIAINGSGSWRLPNEIQCEIFRYLGKPSEQREYQIKSFDDVHPGYAICSTSRGLRANYLAAVGYPPDEITISIHPKDYLINGGDIEDMRAKLQSRLALLGPVGVKRITSIRIFGSLISRESDSIFANAWLCQEKKRLRLDPGVLEVIKHHIEQDLADKKVVLQQLFTCISDLLKTQKIKELNIFAGEWPATTWQAPLTSYLDSHTSVRMFEWIGPDDSVYLRGYPRNEDIWPYFARLMGKRWFKAADERPHNYPESPLIHRQNCQRLTTSLLAYLLSRQRVHEMRLKNQ